MSVILLVRQLFSGSGFDFLRVKHDHSLLVLLSGGSTWAPDNLTYIIGGVLFIVGSVVVMAFFRLKIEDEFTSCIRREPLQWAVFLSYTLMLLIFLFLYGMNILAAMYYNMFTVLIFTLRFHWVLYRQNRHLGNEE